MCGLVLDTLRSSVFAIAEVGWAAAGFGESRLAASADLLFAITEKSDIVYIQETFLRSTYLFWLLLLRPPPVAFLAFSSSASPPGIRTLHERREEGWCVSGWPPQFLI